MSRPIRDFRDAELAARDWLRSAGFEDAELTPGGADGGVDVRSSELVAQVKAELKPVGRPIVQQIFGIASAEGRKAACFAFKGFTKEAVAWANEQGIALLVFNYAGEVEPQNSAARRLVAVKPTPVPQEPAPQEPLSPWAQLGTDFPPDQHSVTARLDQWGVGKPEVVWSVSRTEALGWLVRVEPTQIWPSRLTTNSGVSALGFWAEHVSLEDWPFEVAEAPLDAWWAPNLGPAFMWEATEKEFSGYFDTVEEAFRALERLYGAVEALPSDYDLEWTPRTSPDEHGAGHDPGLVEELANEARELQSSLLTIIGAQMALLDVVLAQEAEAFEAARSVPTSTGYDSRRTRIWLDSWCVVRQTVRGTLDIAKDCERAGLPFMLDRIAMFMALVLFEPTLRRIHKDVDDDELAAMFNRRVEIESGGEYTFVAETDEDDANYFRRNTSMIGKSLDT